MIALVDLGAGNLRSVEKALLAVGAKVQVTSDPALVRAADQVVLPGVGAFADGMSQLAARGLLPALREIAERRTPLLGICLGMQLLFEEGEEHGRHAGLGLLRGRVRRLPEGRQKVPHTGWNQLLVKREVPLLRGIGDGAYAYFNHSYFCDAEPQDLAAQSEHGALFAAVVERDGWLHGVQFHPEKSQRVGLAMLRNFVERC